MNIILLIVLMALVTYLPRVIPAFIIDKVRLGGSVEKFLNLIPYTAMAALIFPGVLEADAGRWYIGVIGAAVAIGLSCIKKIPPTAVVLASVCAVMLVYLI